MIKSGIEFHSKIKSSEMQAFLKLPLTAALGEPLEVEVYVPSSLKGLVDLYVEQGSIPVSGSETVFAISECSFSYLERPAFVNGIYTCILKGHTVSALMDLTGSSAG